MSSGPAAGMAACASSTFRIYASRGRSANTTITRRFRSHRTRSCRCRTHRRAPIAVAIDEEDHAHSAEEMERRRGRPHGCLWVFDVTDFSIKPLSSSEVSEPDSPWSRATPAASARISSGAHEGTLVYCTWFSGGLRIGDVDDAQAAREPGAVHQRAVHVLLELVRAEACPAPRGSRASRARSLRTCQRLDVRRIGDIEHPQAAVRPAAPALHLVGAVRVVLLVDRHRDAPPADPLAAPA